MGVRVHITLEILFWFATDPGDKITETPREARTYPFLIPRPSTLRLDAITGFRRDADAFNGDDFLVIVALEDIREASQANLWTRNSSIIHYWGHIFDKKLFEIP